MAHAEADARMKEISLSTEQQLANGVMLSAIIRTLQLVVGGTSPLRMPSIWSATCSNQRGPQPRKQASKKRPRFELLGLNYRQSMQRFKMGWLPYHLVDWVHPPRFTANALSRLALTKNAFQRTFTRLYGKKLPHTREELADRVFQEYLHAHRQHPSDIPEHEEAIQKALKLGASRVIQAYIQELFAHLATRLPSALPGIRIDTTRRLETFLAPLSPEEKQGLRGLHYDMIARLLTFPPTLLTIRGNRKTFGRNQIKLGEFWTGAWIDMVWGLFAFDDNHSNIPPQECKTDRRLWHHCPFRQLIYRISTSIASEFDRTRQIQFTEILREQAAQKLWIIPRYVSHRISSTRTANAQYPATMLERTYWVAAELDVRLKVWQRYEYGLTISNLVGDALDTMFKSEGESEDESEKQVIPRATIVRNATTEVMNAKANNQWRVNNRDNINVVLTHRNPNDHGYDLCLTDAEAFWAEVDARFGEVSTLKV